MIKHSIEINRPAEEVFAYLDQVDRHNEWQGSLVSATVKTAGLTRVGTRVVERRKVPGGTRDIPYEITEHDPPRKASFRGTAGPLRPVGTYTVDPTGESSSRMNLELDLEGHGIGPTPSSAHYLTGTIGLGRPARGQGRLTRRCHGARLDLSLHLVVGARRFQVFGALADFLLLKVGSSNRSFVLRGRSCARLPTGCHSCPSPCIGRVVLMLRTRL
jgi:uncharacterized protein YndB with AHSA1/START domain